MYEALLKEAKSVNKTVNVLREFGETNSAVYLESGFLKAVAALCSGGFVSTEEVDELKNELVKRKEE